MVCSLLYYVPRICSANKCCIFTDQRATKQDNDRYCCRIYDFWLRNNIAFLVWRKYRQVSNILFRAVGLYCSIRNSSLFKGMDRTNSAMDMVDNSNRMVFWHYNGTDFVFFSREVNVIHYITGIDKLKRAADFLMHI